MKDSIQLSSHHRFLRSFLPWLICLVATALYFYDFLLRVFPGVMIHPLMMTFQVKAGAMGVLSAFYYFAYTPLQLPAGVILDRYKPRIVLTLSALTCALGAILFSLTHTFALACLARAMMGIGSAFAFVGALKLAAIWLPENRFALFAGLTTAVGTLGAVTADNFLSKMVHNFGWEQTIFIAGLAGIILTVMIFLLVKKRAFLEPKKTPEEDRSWKNVFKRLLALSKSFYIWLNGLVGLILFIPISVFASLWGVDFISSAYHIHTTHAASATSLVFIGLAVFSPLVGYLSDKIHSRKIPLFIGNIGCILSAYFLIYSPSHSMMQAYLLLFLLGACAAPQVLVFAIAKDIGPKFAAGSSTAITNFIVTIGACLFQPLIGFALEYHWAGLYKPKTHTPLYTTQDYQFAFLTFIGSLIFCLVLVLLLPGQKKIQRIRSKK